MTEQDRDWVNSPAHILRQKIEAAETDALVAIISGNRDFFKKSMLELSKLYDEEK